MDGFERYESTPMPVTAKRVWLDTEVWMREGRRTAFAGSWIVVAPSGDAAIYPDDVFRAGYRPVNSAAEKQCQENPGKGLHPVVPYNYGEEPPN